MRAPGRTRVHMQRTIQHATQIISRPNELNAAARARLALHLNLYSFLFENSINYYI